MLLNNDKTKQRPKSERKSEGINRFDAHDYERTIQNLLEKIEELESKLILVCKDKYDVISEKQYFENENKNLKAEIEDQSNKNKKLSNINVEFEQAIKDLRLDNKNIRDKANVQLKYLNNQIDDHKHIIKQLNNQIDLKNEKIKNYSVDNKLIQKTSNDYQNILNKQMDINKNQNKKIINLEKNIADYAIKKKDESALLLEIELLRKDNIRLLNILNSTEEYKNFCYLGQTAPGGIRYIKPKVVRKAATYKPMSKKEERARSLKEYKKYKDNQRKKIEKEDRNWVPLEAYNYLVESNNKYNLDLNNDIIESLLLILNKFWQERLEREINRYRLTYQNEIKELKRKLQNKDKERDTTHYMTKSTTNFNNISNKFIKNSVAENIFEKKIRDDPSDGTDNYFYKTAISFKEKNLEDEVERLKKKLNEKNNKQKSARSKIYNQGNLLMTGRSIEEIQKLKKKVDDLYKEYEERVKYSIDNNYDNVKSKNRIVDDSVRIFFSSVQKAIDDLEKKISNWKFNIQKNIGGLEYANKNK